jgi:hypothetical protein
VGPCQVVSSIGCSLVGMSTEPTLVFRVTGPQSIERIERLVPQVLPTCDSICRGPGSADYCREKREAEDNDNSATSDDIETPSFSAAAVKVVHFVWETTCEQTWRDRHNAALVLNKLHNVTILEDKSNLAFLQIRMKEHYEHVLPTYVAKGAREALRWCEQHWSSKNNTVEIQNKETQDSDWWVLKASKGNGGKDIWVTSRETFRSIFEELLPLSSGVDDTSKSMKNEEEYVIQKYVSQPLLYEAKKFHFRCYTSIRADMSALCYHMAYILTAGYDYNTSNIDGDDDLNIHRVITNLSVNKHIPGYPGQIPCNMVTEYPYVYKEFCRMWKAVALACTPFMSKQLSNNHFEFFGIDIVADVHGRCWLLEVNRLPGLESSALNKEAEDTMYDTMMTSLLRIVLKPLQEQFNPTNNVEPDYGMWEIVHSPSDEEISLSLKGLVTINPYASSNVPVVESNVENFKGGDVWKNMFSWRAFTRRQCNRDLVMVDRLVGKSESVAKSGNMNIDNICAVSMCSLPAPFQCSKCKEVYYCCVEHQKEDWKGHKKSCKLKDSSTSRAAHPPKPAAKVISSEPKASKVTMPTGETRQSRCMFCGENVIMSCEEDGHKHMAECPALQEQLGSSDQFTIPKALRDKGVTMKDVKQAPQL